MTGQANIFGIAPQHTPTEAIDDPDHGIQRVEEAILVRDDGAQKTNWRNIKPKLNGERDDEPKIAVLHHQSRHPQADGKRSGKGQKNKNGMNTILAGGRNRYHIMSTTRKAAEIKKSMKLVMTELAGTMRRGK